MDFSPIQLAIVAVIILLLFGPKRLPELGRSLGRGMREFKDSITGKEPESEPESGEGNRQIEPGAGPGDSSGTQAGDSSGPGARDEDSVQGEFVGPNKS